MKNNKPKEFDDLEEIEWYTEEELDLIDECSYKLKQLVKG